METTGSLITEVKGKYKDLSLIKQDLMLAVQRAWQHHSKLLQYPDLLEIAGMSSKKIRHLLNNVVAAMEPVNYLEVGTWAGTSLACAMYANQGVFIGIDNLGFIGGYSGNDIIGFDGKKDPEGRKKILRTCIQQIKDRFGEGKDVQFIEQDFRNVDPASLEKVSVFYYDANHEPEYHYQGIKHFESSWEDRVVVMVDDWQSPGVKEATQQAFSEIDFQEKWGVELRVNKNQDTETWWGGFMIALLVRKE